MVQHTNNLHLIFRMIVEETTVPEAVEKACKDILQEYALEME